MEDIPADIRMRNFSTIQKITAMYKEAPEELDKLDNLWIHGPHGCGKSTWVHRSFPGAYKKGVSKWWDGFRPEEPKHKIVVVDDLHPKWSEKELLKNWADLFPFVAEVKGGSMLIRPERIVITSNYTPQEVLIILIYVLWSKCTLHRCSAKRTWGRFSGDSRLSLWLTCLLLLQSRNGLWMTTSTWRKLMKASLIRRCNRC